MPTYMKKACRCNDRPSDAVEEARHQHDTAHDAAQPPGIDPDANDGAMCGEPAQTRHAAGGKPDAIDRLSVPHSGAVALLKLLLRHPRLSSDAWAVYGALYLLRSAARDRCFTARGGLLARMTGRRMRAVRGGIAELLNAGLLRVVIQGDGRNASVYTLPTYSRERPVPERFTGQRFAAEIVDGTRCKTEAVKAAIAAGWPRRRAEVAMSDAIKNGLLTVKRVKLRRGRSRHVLHKAVTA